MVQGWPHAHYRVVPLAAVSRIRGCGYAGYAEPGMSPCRERSNVGIVTSIRGRVPGWLLQAWPCLPFLACGLVGTQPAAAFQPHAARAPDALAYMLVAAAALALAERRRPGLSLVLNGTAVTVYLAAGFPYGPILLTIPAAAYRLATRWPPGQASLAVTANFGVLIVAMVAKRVQEPASGGVGQVAWTVLVWGAIIAAAFAVGAAMRARRTAAAGIRTEQARRVASEERLRMAQELHDSIGHGLAVIAMQAGVALHVLDSAPADARAAMKAVQAASRESLDNLRAQLETLRSPDAAEPRPVPGLRDLGQLAQRVRAGGVTLQLDIEPVLPALPPKVDAAAYRILQESLTNVLRHAGASQARIRVGLADGTLSLDVTDTGPASAEPPGRGAGPDASAEGSGIRGMRAQAEALGGTLRAGPCPAGGFEVAARLPLRDEEGRY
jgi:signal transduction histidine kinase